MQISSINNLSKNIRIKKAIKHSSKNYLISGETQKEAFDTFYKNIEKVFANTNNKSANIMPVSQNNFVESMSKFVKQFFPRPEHTKGKIPTIKNAKHFINDFLFAEGFENTTSTKFLKTMMSNTYKYFINKGLTNIKHLV